MALSDSRGHDTVSYLLALGSGGSKQLGDRKEKVGTGRRSYRQAVKDKATAVHPGFLHLLLCFGPSAVALKTPLQNTRVAHLPWNPFPMVQKVSLGQGRQCVITYTLPKKASLVPHFQ